jgi:membrane protein DedA with SNARE-associated domain
MRTGILFVANAIPIETRPIRTRTMLSVLLTSPIWTWIHRLGGPGLILLGLIDNSVIPVPGSMDVFVILLSAHRPEWWPYYAFMATVGAVLGGYVTYRLAEVGGEEALEKEFGKSRAQKAYKRFEKRGFSTVTIGAILPPPFPIVPVLMAAGILHYPRKNFLSALGLGRAIRFFTFAYLGRFYGPAVIHWAGRYYKTFLYLLIGVAVLAVIAVLAYIKWYRPKRQREERQGGQPVEAWPMPGQSPPARQKKNN